MSARQVRLAVGCILLISALACEQEDGPLPECDSGSGAAVQSVNLLPLLDQSRPDENGVTLPIEVTATVPCFRGTLRAGITTTIGTFPETSAGEQYSLSLTPDSGGKLVGYAYLTVPYHFKATLNASAGDAVDTEVVPIQLPASDAGTNRDR